MVWQSRSPRRWRRPPLPAEDLEILWNLWKKTLEFPENLSWENLKKMMKKWYGAELEDFIIPIPEQENNMQTEENDMEETEVIKDDHIHPSPPRATLPSQEMDL